MCGKILETFRRGWLRGQILLVLGSAGAWTGAILAGKSDSSRLVAILLRVLARLYGSDGNRKP